ncbi:MAG: hypothetical protein AMJ93_10255 [Anaerolineae bacterium SM23_84]|nr:MAG: hypothetical protein AMJ93_10255 [Anaerolineae bacterium SM23_84]
MGDILVCGYPRSGNVWISRLLGDALDRPVVGKNGALSLATGGKNRPGPYRIMQAHVYPEPSKQFWNGNRIDLERGGDRKYVFVVRDPRDVLVSSAAFWGWSLEETMQKMVEGPGPQGLPPWRTFVEAWFNRRIPSMRYEDFHQDAKTQLANLLDALKEQPRKPLDEVVYRQSFDVMRAEMERYGDTYPFGRDAQLRHLRKGGTGEWETELPLHMARLALTLWKRPLTILGYYQEPLSC